MNTGVTELSGEMTYGTGDTRVLKNRVRLEGGVFQGTLETDREVPTGHVVTIAVQRFRDGNGEQRIQRSSYVVCGGYGKVL